MVITDSGADPKGNDEARSYRESTAWADDKGAALLFWKNDRAGDPFEDVIPGDSAASGVQVDEFRKTVCEDSGFDTEIAGRVE